MSPRLRLGGGHPHAAGLAAPAGRDLRLDHERRPEPDRRRRVVQHDTAGHRDAAPGEQRLRLVLEQEHQKSRSFTSSTIHTSRPGGRAPAREPHPRAVEPRAHLGEREERPVHLGAARPRRPRAAAAPARAPRRPGRLLADGRLLAGHLGQPAEERASPRARSPVTAEEVAPLLVVLDGHRPERPRHERARGVDPEHLQQRADAVLDVAAGEVPVGPVTPLIRPGGGIEPGGARRVEVGRARDRPALEPLLRREVAVVLLEVALVVRLAVLVELGQHEAQSRAAQRHAVVRVPAREHGPGRAGGHREQPGPREPPGGRQVTDPHLARRLLYVLHAQAPNLVRQVVVAPGDHRRRQVAGDPELRDARPESAPSGACGESGT